VAGRWPEGGTSASYAAQNSVADGTVGEAVHRRDHRHFRESRPRSGCATVQLSARTHQGCVRAAARAAGSTVPGGRAMQRLTPGRL
jgi:hypothetical protein